MQHIAEQHKDCLQLYTKFITAYIVPTSFRCLGHRGSLVGFINESLKFLLGLIERLLVCTAGDGLPKFRLYNPFYQFTS